MKSFYIRDILQLDAEPECENQEVEASKTTQGRDVDHGLDAVKDIPICVDVTEKPCVQLEDGNNKSVAWRKKFSSMQRKSLEESFTVQKYLTVKQRDLLAKKIKLSSEQVKTWYQNRRTRWRKNQLAKWKTSWKARPEWCFV